MTRHLAGIIIQVDGIETLDQGFVSSDHNPVRLRFALEADAV